MNYQDAFNIAFTLLGGLMGFVLRSLWQANADLTKADKELADKVGKIEVLVAGKYVTRDDFKESMDKLHARVDGALSLLSTKMDNILTAMNNKADRREQ